MDFFWPTEWCKYLTFGYNKISVSEEMKWLKLTSELWAAVCSLWVLEYWLGGCAGSDWLCCHSQLPAVTVITYQARAHSVQHTHPHLTSMDFLNVKKRIVFWSDTSNYFCELKLFPERMIGVWLTTTITTIIMKLEHHNILKTVTTIFYTDRGIVFCSHLVYFLLLRCYYYV